MVVHGGRREMNSVAVVMMVSVQMVMHGAVRCM